MFEHLLWTFLNLGKFESDLFLMVVMVAVVCLWVGWGWGWGGGDNDAILVHPFQ